MRKSHFTEDQILGMLREVDAGRPVVEFARAHGVTAHTLYRWLHHRGHGGPAWRVYAGRAG